MAEPTREDIDALVGPATPHFAYQLRARVEELVADCPTDHPVRRTARRRWSSSTGSGTRPRRPRTARASRARGPAGTRSRAPRPRTTRCPGVSRRRPSVLVTGGTRGIGKAIALRFAELGAERVAIGYLRNDSRRRGGGRGAPRRGRRARARPRQRRLRDGRRGVRDARAVRRVVHNAATGVIRTALETEDKHWDWTLGANARALLSLARACAPDMKPGSSIVGVSSLGSKRVLENYVLVGTSKAALESVVRYLAVELAPRGIRVNAVSAGSSRPRALDHFPNREQMLAARPSAHAGRPDGRAGGRRRRGRVPLLRRRRRWSAGRR